MTNTADRKPIAPTLPAGAPPRGFVLEPGTRVVSKHINLHTMGVRLPGGLPNSEARWALFQKGPTDRWVATGDVLTNQGIKDRVQADSRAYA